MRQGWSFGGSCEVVVVVVVVLFFVSSCLYVIRHITSIYQEAPGQ